MITRSTQTEVTSVEDPLDTSFLSVDDNPDSDPDWVPEKQHSDDGQQASEEINPAKERKFIIFESCLDILLNECSACGSTCNVWKKAIGSYIQVRSTCANCHKVRKWESQPTSGSMPLGNLIIAGAILFSGSSPSKFLTLCNHASIQLFTIGTYMNIQNLYLVPTVESVWQSQQCDLITAARNSEEPLRLGGDGRCCSPGHTAKYSSYTLMDLKTNKIIAVELVQVLYDLIYHICFSF